MLTSGHICWDIRFRHDNKCNRLLLGVRQDGQVKKHAASNAPCWQYHILTNHLLLHGVRCKLLTFWRSPARIWPMSVSPGTLESYQKRLFIGRNNKLTWQCVGCLFHTDMRIGVKFGEKFKRLQLPWKHRSGRTSASTVRSSVRQNIQQFMQRQAPS